ncbi:hypothetical protein LXL04_025694 [Taraxacum kok-saghyz]
MKMTQTAHEDANSSRPLDARVTGAKWSKSYIPMLYYLQHWARVLRQLVETPNGWQGHNCPEAAEYHATCEIKGKMVQPSFQLAGKDRYDPGRALHRRRLETDTRWSMETTTSTLGYLLWKWDNGKLVNKKRPPPQTTNSAAGIYV